MSDKEALKAKIASLQAELAEVEASESIKPTRDAAIEVARARGIPDKHIAGTEAFDRRQRQTEAGLRFLLNEGLNPFDTLGMNGRRR